MGLETRCAVRVDDSAGSRDDPDAKVELEGEGLVVRGPARTKVARSAITGMHVEHGVLVVVHDAGTLRLSLGDAAEKWRAKIAEGPKSRAHRLGVKPGMRVTLVEVGDPTIGREIAEAGAIVVDDHLRAPGQPVDLLLMELGSKDDLARIPLLAESIGTGALWVIHPNGMPEMGDVAIFAVAKQAGLVATKVMAFSAGMSAERLSRPKK